MAISQRLDIRIGQTQTMTPQLQQAIEMLQMTNLELAEFVEQQLEQNPLLERGDAAAGEGADNAEAQATPDSEETIFDAAATQHQQPADGSKEAPLDTTYENYWDERDVVGESSTNLSNWQGSGGSLQFDNEDSDYSDRQAGKVTLREHLLEQIAVDIAEPSDRIIATYLIDMLDEAGYFRGDVHNVAQALECAPERVTFTLLRLQQLDPAGIFARNLSECLALQLKEKDRLDPIMQKFLAHLDLLGSHKLAELQKICGVDAEDIKDMIAEIRELNPKPAEAFASEAAQPIVPDIIMRPQKGGGWHIELNSDTLPRVLINNRYYSEVKNGAKSKEDKKYLSEKFQMANWLVKAMHQRATTILKVATEIVQQQESFFHYGVEYLRPLVRREVAEAVSMHESTVSRVTTNKFIQTPRGIFELRYFFGSGLQSASGNMSHSSESIRHKIKTLIDAEAPEKPLSDDKIVTILKNEGVEIARRTVAKYREQLHIPASSDRKRRKTINL